MGSDRGNLGRQDDRQWARRGILSSSGGHAAPRVPSTKHLNGSSIQIASSGRGMGVEVENREFVYGWDIVAGTAKILLWHSSSRLTNVTLGINASVEREPCTRCRRMTRCPPVPAPLARDFPIRTCDFTSPFTVHCGRFYLPFVVKTKTMHYSDASTSCQRSQVACEPDLYPRGAIRMMRDRSK